MEDGTEQYLGKLATGAERTGTSKWVHLRVHNQESLLLIQQIVSS